MAVGALSGCSGPDRFNLQCHVLAFEWDQGAPGLSKDYNVEYRIDLSRKKWCADKCEHWSSLRVDGQTLTIWDADIESAGRDGAPVHQRIHQTIDRKTGKLASAIYIRLRPGPFDESQDKAETVEGDCTTTPFKPPDGPT